MNQVIIDGNIVKTKKEFHEQMALQLHFPDYYGKNLDAMYDCLTEQKEGKIIFRNMAKLSDSLGDYLDSVMEVILALCKNGYAYEVAIEKNKETWTMGEEEAETFE